MLLFFVVVVVLLNGSCLAVPPAEQQVSGQERSRQLQDEEKRLRKKIQQEKAEPKIEQQFPAEGAGVPGSEEKVLIKRILVTGATLLPGEAISDIVTAFENKELSIKDMQKAADMITDAYRKKGYITSRAYLPPQKIKENSLEISVIEGITGDTEVKGSRYFKPSLLKKKIKPKKGEVFNYNILRRSLSWINEHPDRNVRAVLAPGKESGVTDIILEVKDHLPLHTGFGWDNFASRYAGKNRYQNTLTHNNLSGFDDMLALQYQVGDADDYRLTSLRYLFPFSMSSEIGFFTARTKMDLGREYEDLTARGKSHIFNIYLNQNLFEGDRIAFNLNLGFDYKDIFNFQVNEESSRDRLRIMKIAADVDISDSLGRTIINNEVNIGIPHIMGGLKDKDSRASRAGSGGKFVKDTMNILRLITMPFSSSLLAKFTAQLSPYTLAASEQFQLGGIANVRGYPPAEHVGDKGYTMTGEWSFPFYPIGKSIKVPFSSAKFYDALKIAVFYDWGNVRLRSPLAGEEKYETLRSAGCGIRFNLPEDFSLRLDLAWPLDKTPSDSNHLHPWIQLSKEF